MNAELKVIYYTREMLERDRKKPTGKYEWLFNWLRDKPTMTNQNQDAANRKQIPNPFTRSSERDKETSNALHE